MTYNPLILSTGWIFVYKSIMKETTIADEIKSQLELLWDNSQLTRKHALEICENISNKYCVNTKVKIKSLGNKEFKVKVEILED
jgi:hypothetical protein